MAAGDAGARKRRRLSRSGEFDRVYREGSSHATRYLVLYSFPRGEDDGEVRLGVSAGRKVGGAVERNRAKRALREAFWDLSERLPPGHDFVLVARPGIADLLAKEGGAAVAQCVEQALSEVSGEERFA
jgi:ribonuclease P protein component